MAGAIAFLIYVPEPGTGASSASDEEGATVQRSVAENVSRFYEEFKQISRDPIKEQYGDYVVPLDNQNDPLGDSIKSVTKKSYEALDNWQGDYKERPFAKGSTLKSEAEKFVSREGMNLVWDLNQDFKIKDRFISDNTLSGMLEEIAGAVDANFDHPIIVYYCARKRALVITTRESDYLDRNCQKSEGSYDQYY